MWFEWKPNVSLSNNPGYNILELYIFLVQSNSPQVKRNLISNVTNLVHKLPHGLPDE